MDQQQVILDRLYGTKAGRMLVWFLIKKPVSDIVGWFLDSRLSTVFISGFIKRNNIDMTQYEDVVYKSYNDFFTRKVKPGMRKFDCDKKALCSPCDSKLTVYKIDSDSHFRIKGTEYTMQQLFRSKKAAKRYEGGLFLLFRLTVDDYHRYSYIDDGETLRNHRIQGVYHTVNPIANDYYPIYKENTREFSLLKSENFGDVLMMEVGAMMVGRISNWHKAAGIKVRRGQEKGYFEFGGSTVVICLEKDKAVINEDIIKASSENIETPVKMGQIIGHAIENQE